MRHLRLMAIHAFPGLALSALVATALQAQAKPLPLKYVGPPTAPAITAGDLMTRLYKYADDSMMGREVGTPYLLKAAAYIEGELRRMGLKPGGTNGSFYQDFPIWSVSLDPASSITVGSTTLPLGKDFLIVPGGRLPAFSNVPIVYGGLATDTTTMLDSAAVAGKILMLRPLPVINDTAVRGAIVRSASYRAYMRASAGAAARIQLQGDSLSPAMITSFNGAQVTMAEAATATATGPVGIMVMSLRGAERIFGAPLASLTKGQTSAPATVTAREARTPLSPGRNVIGILPGSDPALRGQYVVVGAHSDHVGFRPLPATGREHDSLRIFNMVGRPAGAEGGRNVTAEPITPEEWAKMNRDIADLRKVYPSRPDSISNGADDDGSGSVSVLEIAEAFAKGSVKPKRSILFIWQAGEEMGMWGSGYFMDHPTVPRDSLVAQMNIDMVGRGAPTDVTGQGKAEAGQLLGPTLHGGERYLQLVGSRRLSTELGDLVETVNTTKKHGFSFDYNIDADGHQQNIYCRSDHWSYAKWGVPVVFFTTGGHADYHQVTDEPQYIRYDHMALVDKLIFDITLAVADLPHRPLVDKKPATVPVGACRQ